MNFDQFHHYDPIKTHNEAQRMLWEMTFFLHAKIPLHFPTSAP